MFFRPHLALASHLSHSHDRASYKYNVVNAMGETVVNRVITNSLKRERPHITNNPLCKEHKIWINILKCEMREVHKVKNIFYVVQVLITTILLNSN